MIINSFKFVLMLYFFFSLFKFSFINLSMVVCELVFLAVPKVCYFQIHNCVHMSMLRSVLKL
uniref:Uncharacterized protein n=1 Tax=Scytodes thoracica TaxID=1112478 RepID=A0A0A0V757_SCYTH|nr:hypothetical protein [Scytodes thoracica]